MVKKTGKIVLFLLLLQASVLFSSLRVMITDMHDNQVQQVEESVPFFVRVIASNIDVQGQPKGFDQWKNMAVSFAGTSQSTRIVNGNKSQSITYQFIATASQKGTFKCPPLTIQDRSGKIIESNSVDIVVADSTQIVDYQNSARPYVLYVQLDQKEVYLGQKISALLRFGYQQDFSNLQLSQEPMEFFHQGYVQTEPTQGSFELDGQKYKSQDFLIELYPEKLGTLTIPMFKAVFVPDVAYQRVPSLFSMMLSGNSVIESLPRSVQVKQLPVSTEYPHVTAIGDFDSVQFSLNTKSGKVGEGIVAKMTVTGSGNLQVVHHPVLQLPEGLQYYEGNSQVTGRSNKQVDVTLNNSKMIDYSRVQSTKEFEWIIQAEHAGTFDIPAQEFVYFDPKTEEYHVLHSKPVTLTIAGTMTSSEKQEKIKAQSEMQPEQSVEKSDDQTQQPEIVKSSWSISWSWEYMFSFIKQWIQETLLSRQGTIKTVEILVLILLLLLFIFGIRRFVQTSFFIKTLSIRIEFARACRNKDMQKVYQLFEQLMQRYGLSFDSLQLQKCFSQLNMPTESFENWKNFVTMIWEMNFAKDRATDEHELAFALAKEWFSVILSCCKLQSKK